MRDHKGWIGLGLVTALLVAACSRQPEPQRVAPRQATSPAAPRVAEREAVPEMLELYAEACPVCLEMKAIVAEVAATCRSEGVSVRALDVSRPENERLLEQYEVDGVPTFVFLDGAGAEVTRLVGRQPAEKLVRTLAGIGGVRCEMNDSGAATEVAPRTHHGA